MKPFISPLALAGLLLASTLHAQPANTNRVLDLDGNGSYVELTANDRNALVETMLQAAGNGKFLRTFDDVFRVWQSGGRGRRLLQNRSFN